MNPLLLRLFAPSFVLMIAAALLAMLLTPATLQPADSMRQTILQPLFQLAPWIVVGLLISSVLLGLVNGLRLWRWMRGEGALCQQCSGLTVQRTGRFGVYEHCLVCRKNGRL